VIKIQKQVAKFDIKDILPIGLTIVVTGIGVAYGLDIMGDTRDDFVTDTAHCNSTHTSACGAAYNGTTDAIDGVGKLPEKLPLIVNVIVAAIIIGILVRYLMVRFG